MVRLSRWAVLTSVGQILATGISIPFGRDKVSNRSWRAPILIQIVPAAINVIFVLFLYESPRWIYTRRGKDAAAKILAHFHSRDENVNSPVVALELAEIEEHISMDGADKRWWDFRALFSNKANSSRFGRTIIISVWGQLSGNGLITCGCQTMT